MRRIFQWISLSLLGLALLATTLFFVLVPGQWRQMIYAGASIIYHASDYPADAIAEYKTTATRPLYINIFKPAEQAQASKTKAAVTKVPVVLFHGGGFTGGWPAQFFPYARRLANAGHMVFVPEYRLQHRDSVYYQDALEDTRDAVSWVLDQADHYGIDPNQLVLGGSSAGSHFPVNIVTQALGISHQPMGFLLINPYVNSNNADPGAEGVFNGQGAMWSPSNRLHRGMSPMVLFHGVKDKIVPFKDSQAFCQTAVKLDISCRLIEYPDSGHAVMGFESGNLEDIAGIMIQSIEEWSH